MSFLSSMKAIQQDALDRGGSYVHYSQCLEPTSTLINMLPYTSGGICQALSAKWIAEHANDSSLWNWLFAEGTTHVKQAAIANLMINFTESVVRTASDIEHNQGNRATRKKIAFRIGNKSLRKANTGGQFYQDFVTDKYLGLYGLKRRTICQPSVVGSMQNQIPMGTGLSAGYLLGSYLNEDWLASKGGGSYVLISIMGSGGGHAMAAYVGNDIAFFDPNYGEFWFPTHQQFYEFFMAFWRSSGYYQDFNRFYLLPYAKGV